ncbi:hypothetical protein [Staphylococcus pseudoxylosus]|uniref:hypothetical protein n=1 Tax=Staphylococcus pseudoxylosus TaxID=2282419 RepID=UPI003F576CCF
MVKKQKFKRLAIDLLQKIEGEGMIIEYIDNTIWFHHSHDNYKEGMASIYMFNNTHKDTEILARYEQAKKVIAGERLVCDE